MTLLERAIETAYGEISDLLPLDLLSQSWRLLAACANLGEAGSPISFFLERGEPSKEAKAICAECPVSADCLNYALANNEPFGIWGGMTVRERRAEKRRRKKAGI